MEHWRLLWGRLGRLQRALERRLERLLLWRLQLKLERKLRRLWWRGQLRRELQLLLRQRRRSKGGRWLLPKGGLRRGRLQGRRLRR